MLENELKRELGIAHELIKEQRKMIENMKLQHAAELAKNIMQKCSAENSVVEINAENAKLRQALAEVKR